MRYNKYGKVLAQVFYGLHYGLFGFVVEGAGGFVEDYYVGLFVEGSCYAYSLALASGEADASFAYECLVFFGPGFDDVGDLGLLGGLLDKGLVDFIYRDSESYVFLDGAVGQEDGLGYVGYMGLPVAGVVYCDFLIIDFKGSLVGLK